MNTLAKKMKRLLSLFVCVVMIVSSFAFTTVAGAAQFKDMPNNWSTAALTHAVNNDLLRGKGDGMLCPDDYLTRAEMATIINRAFNAKVAADISAYLDVSPSEWYHNEFEKALNMQTFYGTGDNMFRPENTITREEVFIAIARALVVSTNDYSVLDKFDDGSDVSSWAKEFVSALVSNGYVNGYGNGLILPKNNITRAEFAQLLYNIFKQYITEPGTYDDVVNDGGVVVRNEGISLSDVTINGDLVIADGVGEGILTLNNVKVNGRLLVRGSKQITVKNCEFTNGIVVKNVNGIVHFDNYRNETPFNNFTELTKATFKDDSYSIGFGGGSSGGSGGTTPVRYTVKFDSDGGSSVADQKVITGGKAVKPEDPTKAGFTFLGWYDARDVVGAEENEFDFAATTITENTTLYAHWGYTVTFYRGMSTREASKIKDEAYHIGDSIPEADVPEKADAKEGFYKNTSISSLYSGKEETHKIDSTWFFKNGADKWEEFDFENTVIEGNLALHNGTRNFVITLYSNKRNLGIDIDTVYEINLEDSHLTNVFKDIIFTNKSNIISKYNSAKIEEKLINRILDYEIIDINKNILIQNRSLKFSTLLGDEAAVRDFTVKNSKTQLKSNPDLADDIATHIEEMDHDRLRNLVYDALLACEDHGDQELKDYTDFLLATYMPAGSTYMDAADLIATQMQSDRDFELDMIDHLIAYLDAHPEELDDIVDEILEEGAYKDMLDTFVDQMVNEREFDINEENKFIAKGMLVKLDTMRDYNDFIDEFVGSDVKKYINKITKIIPEAKIDEIYTNALVDYMDTLDAAINSVSASSSTTVPTFVTAIVNPVEDLFVPIYDKVINRTELELNNYFFYNENAYLREIFDILSPENIFESTAATDVLSGYKIKGIEEYYEMLMKLSVLFDDSAQWYVTEGGLSQSEKDEIMAHIEERVMKLFSYYNKLVAFVDEYAQTGDLPEGFDNEFLQRIENILISKFPVIDKLINKFTGSPLDRPLTDEDYTKLVEVMNALFKNRALTVDDLFESPHADKLINAGFEEQADGSYKLTINDDLTITLKRGHK